MKHDRGLPSPQLQAYLGLLREWAPRLDLVSTADATETALIRRHVDNSLAAAPWVAALHPGDLAIDVGSGAGFPGIPLALTAPAVAWRLVEPRSRRAAFLEEAVRVLDLNAEVVVARAEQLARDSAFARRHLLATARALAPPTQALGLLKPLVAPGGRAAVWVGSHAELPPETTEELPGIASMVLPATD